MKVKASWGALALIGALALAACGDSTQAAGNTGTPAPTTSTTVAPTTTVATTTTVSGATVVVAHSTLGDILTDAKGRTLYVFLKDEKNKSNCTGACAGTWPRFAPASVQGGTGIDASLLGTITVDSAQQATINGMPLYYYAADSASSDTKGQGVGGNWYVVDAKGNPIKS
jgi:predicted lipoprotein with Yx(FWY)xxD motif